MSAINSSLPVRDPLESTAAGKSRSLEQSLETDGGQDID